MPNPPATAVETVVDHYHGVAVPDDYRWLERADDPRVAAWTAAQNAFTRRRLDALANRTDVAARVDAVLRAPHTRYPDLEVGGGQLFVLVNEPPKQQPFLVVMPASADPASARVVLDPNALDPSGKTSIDFFVPSRDGRHVAVSLSKAGTESGDLHVVDVQSGTVTEVLPRVNGGTAGGDVAWLPDATAFFYTRYPAEGERPAEDLGFYQRLYLHRLGDPPAADRLELGDELPRIAEVRIDVDDDGRALASVQLGDGGKYCHFLRPPRGRFRKITDFDDGIVQMAFGPRGDLFAISRHDAPRGVLLRAPAASLGSDKPFEHARRVHAPATDSLVSSIWDPRTMLFRRDRFYATFQLGGPSTVRAFDYTGKPLPFELPFDVASARALTALDARSLVLRVESFVDPPAWYRQDRPDAALSRTPLSESGPIDMSQVRVVRELATSADGTKVPLNILLPPGAELDGKSPCVATGYGGYGISLEPRYGRNAGLWLERGVIFVVANLRGGGEFGEAWHLAGNLVHKQNVFDDFTAVLEHLVARGYTRPERLGIIGGSNGGLLMGAMLTQRPELVRAVVSYVGLYDMLRVELSPNGAFNVTEFGSVQDRAQFDALYAYSPYHHVASGTRYPATLLITAENDARVDPMHSRKMAARLQAATASDAPILLRTNADSGHGSGTDLDEMVAETTDVVSFMLDALQVRAAGGVAPP